MLIAHLFIGVALPDFIGNGAFATASSWQGGCQENGYYAWVFAAQVQSRKWEAFAIIERKADHHEVSAPCMKHRILAEFDTQDEAISAAAAVALDRMRRHETIIALIRDVGNG